jgi:CheY-like chemotaxis protein
MEWGAVVGFSASEGRSEPMTSKSDLPILLVEDSPEDVEAVDRALRGVGLTNPVFHCEDGDDALSFLRGNPPYTDPATAPRPAIIMLDLNLPGTDGRDVLSEIKGDADLKSIPVIIFTSSNLPNDVSHCYQEGANSYIRKPVHLSEFNKAIQSFKEYWFETVVLAVPE